MTVYAKAHKPTDELWMIFYECILGKKKNIGLISSCHKRAETESLSKNILNGYVVSADLVLWLLLVTRASRWRAIAYPRASAIAYLRSHQNSKCVPSVLIHRAIACESFKILALMV